MGKTCVQKHRFFQRNKGRFILGGPKMVFCRKCGAPMAEEDHVCTRCGTEVQDVVKKTEKSNLLFDLEQYRRLLSENEELKTLMKPQSEFPMSDTSDYKKRSFIKYFWPFILLAVAAYTIVYVMAIAITLASLNDIVEHSVSAERATSEILGNTFGGFFIAVLVAVAVIVIGIIISKRKQAEFNKNAEFMNMQVSERYKMGLKNQKMIDIYQDNINKMRKYERFVPEKYRTSAKVNEIINIIKEDKADTVEEAIQFVSMGL